MQNAGLDDAQAGNKIAGRNINNLRYADDTTLMAESKEELKSLLMKVNEESAWGNNANSNKLLSCSDFRAQESSLSLFPLFPHLFAMK